MKKGDDAIHHVRGEVDPETLPEGSIERKAARDIKAYWKRLGVEVQVTLVRMSYRPRLKTESYYRLVTTLTAGLPPGYHGGLNKLGVHRELQAAE